MLGDHIMEDDGLSYGYHNECNKQRNIGIGTNSCATDLI